jgi:hypothetical protein
VERRWRWRYAWFLGNKIWKMILINRLMDQPISSLRACSSVCSQCFFSTTLALLLTRWSSQLQLASMRTSHCDVTDAGQPPTPHQVKKGAMEIMDSELLTRRQAQQTTSMNILVRGSPDPEAIGLLGSGFLACKLDLFFRPSRCLYVQRWRPACFGKF